MIKVQLDKGAFKPEKAHNTDAGFDLRTPFDFCIPKGSYAIINTGVHVQIPYGYAGMIKSKSGLNIYKGIQSEGVVDCEFTGPIVVKLYNHSKKKVRFKKGDKITQLVIVQLSPIDGMIVVDELPKVDDNARGNSGFGSTGR